MPPWAPLPWVPLLPWAPWLPLAPMAATDGGRSGSRTKAGPRHKQSRPPAPAPAKVTPAMQRLLDSFDMHGLLIHAVMDAEWDTAD